MHGDPGGTHNIVVQMQHICISPDGEGRNSKEEFRLNDFNLERLGDDELSAPVSTLQITKQAMASKMHEAIRAGAAELVCVRFEGLRFDPRSVQDAGGLLVGALNCLDDNCADEIVFFTFCVDAHAVINLGDLGLLMICGTSSGFVSSLLGLARDVEGISLRGNEEPVDDDSYFLTADEDGIVIHGEDDEWVATRLGRRPVIEQYFRDESAGLLLLRCDAGFRVDEKSQESLGTFALLAAADDHRLLLVGGAIECQGTFFDYAGFEYSIRLFDGGVDVKVRELSPV